MRRGLGRLVRLPGKLMLATVLLCLALREWYPFSPFPMYASFGPRATYVCVTDSDGQVVPAARYFGLDATMFKKIFETRVLALTAAGMPPEAAEAQAARQTLELLVHEARPAPGAPPLPARIGLQRRLVEIDAEHVRRTQATLAVRGDE